MPDNKQPSSKPARTFRVNHTAVGPFPQGHVFTDAEFKRLHPLPNNAQTREAGLVQAGADAYHADLLSRLQSSGAISPADPVNDEPGQTPLGPENRTAIPAKPGEVVTTEEKK